MLILAYFLINSNEIHRVYAESLLNLASKFQPITFLDKGIIGIFLVAMVTSFS